MKAVNSGNSMIIMAATKSRTGPPPEITLILGDVSVPRLGRTGKVDNEDYAWDSREFLRNMIIGKPVRFKVLRKIEGSNRSFGNVFMSNGTDLTEALVSNGWAKVNERRAISSEDEIAYANLLSLQNVAKENGKGIWAGSKGAGATKNVSSEYDAGALFQELRDKEVDAVIEYVRDGSSYRLVLVEKMLSVVFNLAGIRCPRLGRKPTNGADAVKPEPYAHEAKHFVEVRLLHRRVPVRLKMLNKSGDVFIGQIVHPKGDIGLELLKRGLARVQQWSLSFTQSPAEYVRAEKSAKTAKIRQWQNIDDTSGPIDAFTGTVVEIVSGDTIVVSNDASGVEERVSLSSIRTRRMGGRGRDHEPYALEAREFLRRLVLGKECQVEVEYERYPQQSRTASSSNGNGSSPTVVVLGGGNASSKPRRYATVTLKRRRKNVAVSLVMQGLAECVRHRHADPCSRYLDRLLDAEVKAQSAKKGIHSTASVAATRYRDLTNSKAASRREFPSLSRERRMKAVVEYVFGGGRFKLMIPKQNCYVFFALAGLRCPSRARKMKNSDEVKPAEPMAQEAYTFSRTRLMQRDVEVEVEDVDKGGTMLGTMFAQNGDGETYNVGVHLLSNGLARLLSHSAERSKYRKELFAASDKAEKSNAGIWKFQKDEDDEEGKSSSSVDSETMVPVKICDVVNGQTFYVHRESDAATLVSLNETMKAFGENLGTDLATASPSGEAEKEWTPRKGVLCAALFGVPAAWYRAEIVRFVGKADDRRAIITYVDFGNTEEIPLNRLRPLDTKIASIERLAVRCSLSFVRVPGLDKEYGQEAAESFGRLVWDQSLKMQQTDYDRKEKTRRVVLFADDGKTCINTKMASIGFARVDPFARPRSTKMTAVYDDIKNAMDDAHQKHIGMFEYGDPCGDDF